MLSRLQSLRWQPDAPATLAALIVWFALLTGFAEAGVLLFRRFVMHKMIWASPDVIWLAPAAYLVFGCVLGVAVFALPRLRRFTPIVFVLGFVAVGVVSQLLLGRKIHIIAHLLLAAAGALQLRRLAQQRPEAFVRLVQRTTPALAGLFVLFALGMPLRHRIAEGRMLSRLPDAPAGAPNILLIIWDTVRQRNLSLYGYDRPTTPHLERWSRRGTVFDWALAPAPWTLGTHASLFTGLLTQELSVSWIDPLSRSPRTLAEVFRERGYYPVGFVANLINTSRDTGLGRGFIRYDDFVISPRTLLLNSLAGQRLRHPDVPGHLRLYPVKRAPRITDEFLRWLPETRERPFIAFLNYFDAHDPYYPRKDLLRQFRSGRREIDRYDASIATLDVELDRLLSELRRRSLLDKTIVVLTADHGENFGEKGLYQHGHSLYMPQLHVPLVVWRPDGAGAGVLVQKPVSLRDLPGTLLDLALGAQAPSFPGHSLAGLWAGPAASSFPPAPDTLLAGVPKGFRSKANEPHSRGNMSSILVGNLYYIRNGDGREELYDLARDPREHVNLATEREYEAKLGGFRAAADRLIPRAWQGRKGATSPDSLRDGSGVITAWRPPG